MDDPEFLRALNRYYKLKHQYETNIASHSSGSLIRPKDPSAIKEYILQKKKRFKKKKKKCLICSQVGGMIFSENDRILSARCGNLERPCNLDIQLFIGQFITQEQLMKYWLDEYDESVADIMRLKYDFLFNYLTEQEMSEQLVGRKGDLNEAKEELDESLSSFINIVDNKEKNDLLRMSRAQLAEYVLAMKEYMIQYKKTGSKEALRDTVTLYKDRVLPILKEIRTAVYSTMDFDFERSEEDKDKFGARLTHTEIIHSPFSQQDLEINIGDPPAIIANNI
jgi:hypothetical protein